VENLFLAFYKGQVISYCALRVREKGTKVKRRIGFTDIWVTKRYRKRGVGLTMKVCSIAWAFQKEQADKMETTVERANVASINSCLSQGYDISKSKSTKKNAVMYLRKETWGMSELKRDFEYPLIIDTKRRR